MPEEYPIIVGTNGAVHCTEQKGSPQESYVGQEIKVSRTLACPWGQRWQLARALLGDAEKVLVPFLEYTPGTPVYSVHRELPHRYPGHDYSNKIFASNIESIEGISLDEPDDALEIAQYRRAHLKVNYESLTYAVREDQEILSSLPIGIPFPDESNLKRFVTKVVQPSAESLTLSNGSYKWVPDKTPLLGASSIIVSTQEVHYIWHQVPGKPSAIETHMGTVNDRQFDGYPRDTLLLLAAEVKPYRMVTGLRLCDITYKFKYFQAIDPKTGPLVPPAGHNHFLRYNTQLQQFPQYFELTHNGNSSLVDPAPNNPDQNRGLPVYRRTDFRSLFNPDANIISVPED